MDSLQLLFLKLAFYFFIIIPSAILHEYAHGAAAERLGDPTARRAGRLTLNPAVHVDLWGTILIPFILFVSTGGQYLFAYAKPVPYNPEKLRNKRWGTAAVALAGPTMNFLLAFAFGLVVRLLPEGSVASGFLSIIVYANILLGIFNLMPIPPIDGSKVLQALLSPRRMQQPLEQYGTLLLLIFVFFFFPRLTPIFQQLFVWFTGLPWLL